MRIARKIQKTNLLPIDVSRSWLPSAVIGNALCKYYCYDGSTIALYLFKKLAFGSCKTVHETRGFPFLGFLPNKLLKKLQVYFGPILYRHKYSEPSV
jgi:hypothetical protein